MNSAPRAAAIIMAILSSAPHGVIFIERAAHLRHHAGQIAFPGGAIDPQDGGDARRAALREMEEEVGVTPERVDFVWTFAKLHPRVSNFLVTPFVAVVAPGPLVIDPSETASVFTVPLETVLADVRDGTMNLGAMEIETTLLDYEDKRIWGLTGRVLRMFVDEWNRAESVMRSAIIERLR